MVRWNAYVEPATCRLWLVSTRSIVCPVSLYSLSSKASHRQISWSLVAARLDVKMIVSLWDLTGISAAQIIMEEFKPEFRGFEISRDLAVRRPSA